LQFGGQHLIDALALFIVHGLRALPSLADGVLVALAGPLGESMGELGLLEAVEVARLGGHRRGGFGRLWGGPRDLRSLAAGHHFCPACLAARRSKFARCRSEVGGSCAALIPTGRPFFADARARAMSTNFTAAS